MCSWDRV